MTIRNVSRRRVLAGGAAFALGAVLPVAANARHHAQAVIGLPGTGLRNGFAPNLFLSIDHDGTVSVTSHRSEMGQGIRTAIAQIVADELEADWSRLRVLQAPGDAIYGDQNTDGSQSIRLFYDTLRHAGASARTMLETAAARRWSVPARECRGVNHEVVHKRSGRRLGYGELAADAAGLEVPAKVAFKARGEHRYVGRPTRHVDVDDVISGAATFGADVTLPGMVTAVVVRPPVLGAAVRKVVPPVKRRGYLGYEILAASPSDGPVFAPLGGVAVIAEDTWIARSVADSLKIEWERSPHDDFDSSQLQAQLRAAVGKSAQPVFEQGNVQTALASGTKVEATYETPFLSHAPMEPPVAVAHVEGDRCQVWAPVQDPQSCRSLVAGTLGVDVGNVDINVTLLGGAFGRKSKPDFVLEAVELSRRQGRPVRVIWSREDDIHHDYYHAASAQYHAAALGPDGLPTAWLQRTAFPSITTVFSPQALAPAPWELEMGFSNLPYRIANQRFEATGVRPGVRVGWMRSVCNIFHAFSSNVFVDELAVRAGVDPVDYRLRLLGDTSRDFKVPGMQAPEGHALDLGRMRRVIERVRALSDWDRARPAGRGLGFAVHHSFRSYVGIVLEASVEAGNVTTHNAWVALDCGTYINPDTCRAQMEGAVVFGLSLALSGEITMADGRVQQGNFDDYPILRGSQCPDIAVELIDSDDLPAGVGEPGVPPVAPALVNAVFAATGQRVRRLPIRV